MTYVAVRSYFLIRQVVLSHEERYTWLRYTKAEGVSKDVWDLLTLLSHSFEFQSVHTYVCFKQQIVYFVNSTLLSNLSLIIIIWRAQFYLVTCTNYLQQLLSRYRKVHYLDLSIHFQAFSIVFVSLDSGSLLQRLYMIGSRNHPLILKVQCCS